MSAVSMNPTRCALAKYGCTATVHDANRHYAEAMAYHFTLLVEANERLEREVAELQSVLGRGTAAQPKKPLPSVADGSSGGGTYYHPGTRHSWAAEDDIFGVPAYELWSCCNQSGAVGRVTGCTLLTASAISAALASPQQPASNGAAAAAASTERVAVSKASKSAAPQPAPVVADVPALPAYISARPPPFGTTVTAASPTAKSAPATAAAPSTPAAAAKTNTATAAAVPVTPTANGNGAAAAAAVLNTGAAGDNGSAAAFSPRHRMSLSAEEIAVLELYKSMLADVFARYGRASSVTGTRMLAIGGFVSFLSDYHILPDHASEADVRLAFETAQSAAGAAVNQTPSAASAPNASLVALSFNEFQWALTRLSIETDNPTDSPIDKLKSLLAFFQSTHSAR